MLSLRKLMARTMVIIISFYVLLCALLYLFQEKLIFFPEKLSKDFKFQFSQPFIEVNVPNKKGELLNGLLFRSDSAKGLIFYLHGNAGSVNGWGEVAITYTALQYDVFILDYPGYGKSEGAINNEQELYTIIQGAYSELKKQYDEQHIIVLGYSLGTGPAAKLAASNHPRLLILQAPYYNLTDLMRRTYPIIPTFLLKYKFKTNEHLKHCAMPVVIFHGNRDEVINFKSSLKLKKEFKSSDTLITLDGQTHNGMTDNPEYVRAIATILN